MHPIDSLLSLVIWLKGMACIESSGKQRKPHIVVQIAQLVGSFHSHALTNSNGTCGTCEQVQQVPAMVQRPQLLGLRHSLRLLPHQEWLLLMVQRWTLP